MDGGVNSNTPLQANQNRTATLGAAAKNLVHSGDGAECLFQQLGNASFDFIGPGPFIDRNHTDRGIRDIRQQVHIQIA